MKQGHCSLGCAVPTQKASRITLARGIASCELAWSGSRRSFHLEELQQGSFMRSSFRDKQVGERGGGSRETVCRRNHSIFTDGHYDFYFKDEDT